jgi:hypothetical protein
MAVPMKTAENKSLGERVKEVTEVTSAAWGS